MTKLMTKIGALGIAAVVSPLILIGCGSSDPEAAGAGDAYRNEAQDMPLEEVVTGEIDVDGGDMTDWKAVVIEDAGKVTVQFATDKKDAAVSVGVFDKYGAAIASGSKKGGSDKSAKIQFKAEEGRYFVRIQQKGGGKTTYSVQVSMGDGGGGGGGPDI